MIAHHNNFKTTITTITTTITITTTTTTTTTTILTIDTYRFLVVILSEQQKNPRIIRIEKLTENENV